MTMSLKEKVVNPMMPATKREKNRVVTTATMSATGVVAGVLNR